MNIQNRCESVKKQSGFRIVITTLTTLVLVIIVSNLYPITKAEQGTSLESFTAYLDERIPHIMEAYQIPGVNIALVKGGETIWTKAYGYANLEEGRKMTTDTYLRVESISKSVTAYGIMKLVEQGEIELDSPVSQYLNNWNFPESEFSQEKISVRQLLSHRSGLPLGDFTKRYPPTQKMPSLEDSLSTQAIIDQEPGSSFSYSNVGYNLLELLIEEVTGRDFSEYMDEEILGPLGMNNSSYTWSEDFKPGLPFGYDLKGEPVPVYVYPEKGSGGLLATIEDMATFIGKLSENQPVLSRQSMEMLYTPTADKLGVYNYVFDSYGLGYYLEKLSNGNRAVSHGGQGAGWMTHFHSVPETGDGIVILTNSQRSWPFIAYILSDWAKWNGLSPIGMSRIIWAIYAIWALIAVICFILLWQIWRLVEELISKKRKFAPLDKNYRVLRTVQSSISVILIASLLWCISQEYFFISSLFPLASFWLGISIFIGAIILLLSALFPNLAKERG